MKYLCKCCGNVFDETELKEEDYGCDRGFGKWAASQRYGVCPECGSIRITEAHICKFCGEWSETDVCRECMGERATSANAIDIGKEYQESVRINGFFAHAMNEEEIDRALREWWGKNGNQKKAAQYCFEDEDGFSDWLIEKEVK